MKNAILTVTDNSTTLSLTSNLRVFVLMVASHCTRVVRHSCQTRGIWQRTVSYVPTESSS